RDVAAVDAVVRRDISVQRGGASAGGSQSSECFGRTHGGEGRTAGAARCGQGRLGGAIVIHGRGEANGPGGVVVGEARDPGMNGKERHGRYRNAPERDRRTEGEVPGVGGEV